MHEERSAHGRTKVLGQQRSGTIVLNNVLRSGGVGGADDVGHALHEAVGVSELAAVLDGNVGKSFGVILVAHEWWSPPIRRAQVRYEMEKVEQGGAAMTARNSPA